MLNILHGLQATPSFITKVPQLGQISLPAEVPESRRRNGIMLREAEEDVMSRSMLDQIFVKISQALVASGKVPDRGSGQGDGASQGGGDGQQEADEDEEADEDLDEYNDNIITLDTLTRAMKGKVRPEDMKKPNSGGSAIIANLQELLKTNKRVTLKQFRQALEKARINLKTQVPDTVYDAIFLAAKTGK
jgi:hypothetical protein